jgi:anti-sigma B factor antagonist
MIILGLTDVITGEAPWAGPAGDGVPDPSPGTVTVVLSGELDLVTASFLGQHLARLVDQRPQHLVFDMARVGFIDCAAARLIVGTGRSLPAGRRPVIRSPSAAVRRILMLTGLDAHCEIES